MDVNFKEFTNRFRLLAGKNPRIIINTLSNIFTMRLIGNKTHGDMAEVGIVEFINQFMYDYRGEHVGKELYRAKEHEEDIVIRPELNPQCAIPISLKAYGDGPLQLSTDKECLLFQRLQQEQSPNITDPERIEALFRSPEFREFGNINILPLIYREARKQCNIMIFDFDRAIAETKRIVYVDKNQRFDSEQGLVPSKGRKHPIFVFLDRNNSYICEVRYGGKAANALQRGLWTHTVQASNYFNSLTGWIGYEHNKELVRLIRLALNATQAAHTGANTLLQEDIDSLKLHVR